MHPDLPFDPDDLEHIRQALDEHAPHAPDGRAMLQTFWADQAHAARPTRRVYATRSSWRLAPLAVGAAILVGVLAVLTPSWTRRVLAPTPPQEYAAGVATITKVTLKDGTAVVLAPDTRIVVVNRTVTLHGEAMFTVAHHTGAPFQVIVPATTTRPAVVTRVLGTRFGVRAYDDDVRVAVADGRIAVQDVVASAHDVVRVSSTGVSKQSGQMVDPALAFADGQLDLHDVPLRDAAGDIARWFGLELRFADPTLGNYPITGTFTASSASSLAEILEHTLPVRVEQHGTVLTLHRRATSAAGAGRAQ